MTSSNAFRLLLPLLAAFLAVPVSGQPRTKSLQDIHVWNHTSVKDQAETGAYGGHIYMAENFIRAEVVLFTVHMNAISQDIVGRMNVG
jgi:hypothetical protein